MTRYHKDDPGIHMGAYVIATDPGAVGANKLWVQRTGSPPYDMYVRKADNSDWESAGGTGGAVGAWILGGNNFGVPGVLGTTDAFDLSIIRDSIEVMAVKTAEVDITGRLVADIATAVGVVAIDGSVETTGPTFGSIGVLGEVYSSQTTGTIPDSQGVYGTSVITNTATVGAGSQYGVEGGVSHQGSGTLVNAHSIHADPVGGGAGPITNAIGVYAAAQTAGATNWSGYFESGVFVGSRFGVGAAPDATQAATIRHANWPGSADAEGLYVHTVVNSAGSHLYDAIRAVGESVATTGVVNAVYGIVAQAVNSNAGGEVLEAHAFHAAAAVGPGEMDDAIGFYAEKQTAGDSNYGVYSLSRIYAEERTATGGTGINGTAVATGTGSTMGGYGVAGVMEATGASGTVLDGAAVRGLGLMLGGVNATVLAGVRGDMQNGSSGTIADARVVEARAITNTGGGTVTNAVGIYAEDQTVGTHNYAMLAKGYVEVDESTQGIAFQAYESFTTSGSGDFVNAIGVSASANGSGTGAQVEGLDITALTAGSVAAAYVYGAGIHLANDSSGVATDMHGVHIDAIQNGGGGSVTNAIGLYAEAQTVGTNNWSIYANGAVAIEGLLRLKEIATPATPASGYVCIYVKSDHKLYRKDSTGTETLIG